MRNKKEEMYSIIKGFGPLMKKYKDEMIGYLDEFYEIINNKTRTQQVFITNARTQ